MEHEVWFCPVCRGPNEEFAEECEYCGSQFKKKQRPREPVKEVIEILPKPTKKRRVIRREPVWKPYQHRPAIWSATRDDVDRAVAMNERAQAELQALGHRKDHEAREMFNIYTSRWHDLMEPTDFASYTRHQMALVLAYMLAIIYPMYVVGWLLPGLDSGLKMLIMLASWLLNIIVIYVAWERYQNKLKKAQSQWKFEVTSVAGTETDWDYVA